eukprot:902390_1
MLQKLNLFLVRGCRYRRCVRRVTSHWQSTKCSMNRRMWIYFKCDDFRMYVRIFIALRGIHLDCIDMACDLIRDKAWTGIPGTENRNAFRVLYDEYLIPTW